MASLIKNQIIKRLSKFVKNLSSNQINLSTLKGEGELSSINLDEKALEDVIELPTWLKIQKATCGRVFIKIPWTNLKTTPIQIQLDDVLIEIETCEKLRDLHSPSNTNDPLLGKYGFTNRVIDGISLTITNITFAIKAENFKASIFLPSLDIYSITPNGKRVDNLTLTRLRNATKDHILLFKEISWPNARIEASSNDNNLPGTAIRFIANSCRIGISMKKNLQDSTLVTSRLMVHFDDLLSVVNDAQLKSALNTYKEITQLMKRASDQRKQTAGDKLIKLEQQPSTFQPKLPTTGINEPTNSLNSNQQSNDPFTRYDIIETSLHFNIKRLDLHIVADVADRLVENGSVQMTIANLSFDHYPYHEFGSSRKHWIKYTENQSANRNEWAMKLHDEWHQQFNIAKASVPNDDVSAKFEKALRTNRIRLFESCSVINIDDLVFYPVSLNNDKQQKRRRPLIASDKLYYQLPDSLGIINIQHTEYYYPLPYAFPVPNSDLYIQIMPLVFRVDFETSNWLNAFISTLSITIDNSGVLKTDTPPINHEHVAIKIEAMLPRIVISSDIFHENKSNEQIEILELNISKILVTNTRVDPTSQRNKLQQHLELFKKNNFFQQNQWPFSNTTTTRLSSLFEKHSYETYLYDNPLSKKTSTLPQPQSASKALHTYYTMTTDSLKKAAKYNLWHFNAENIYLDFTSVLSDSDRLFKQNMTDTLSLTGWIVLDKKEESPWANVLGVLESPTMFKISQKQYTFLMHLIDELGLFIDGLTRTNTQAELLKQTPSIKNPADDLKLTICLTTSTTFTLAVIDGLKDETVNHSIPVPSALPEGETEPVLRDTSDANAVIDLITTPTPIIASTSKVEPSVVNKNQKKTKTEENTQRSVDIISKASRGPSLSSSMTASDFNDETSSQLDMSEDLDADFDPSIFINDTEQQQQPKVSRIEIDDDSLSLTGKHYVTTSSELINGVFVKLNQINICLTEDEEKTNKLMYIACEVKNLRLDEFHALKFETIKPKLFENENPDQFNNKNVPPINIRIDLPKDELIPLPILTLQIQDRSLTTTIHAIDILTQNLDEIFTPEQHIIRQNKPPKLVPLDIHLNNVQITLELIHQYSTTHAQIEAKPPTKVNIEYLHVLRQIDGQVIIRNNKKEISSLFEQISSNDNSNEDLQQLESLRVENERLRSELNAHKTEITVLRGERDSLMNTISKLDIELTQAEYRRATQQQQQQPPRKK